MNPPIVGRIGGHDPIDARSGDHAMAKKKVAKRPASSRPAAKSSALPTRKKRDASDKPEIRPPTVEVKHRDYIEFSLIHNQIANYTIESVDLIPDQGEPVRVRIPEWFFYAPSSGSTEDAVDIYSATKARVVSTEGSLNRAASGKLRITIRPPNSIEGNPSSIIHEYENVVFLPG